MNNLGIVFFHMGNSPYQKYTLDLAVKRNDGSDVILITNLPKLTYPNGVKVVDMAEYFGVINTFDKIYAHRNTCKRLFNFRGIVRWLVYYEWWKHNQYKTIFVADSDVMILSDLSKEKNKWNKYFHTLSMGTAGGQSYWFNIDVMKHLVETIWNTYKNPKSESSRMILSHYDNLQRDGRAGGVCDMTFLAASTGILNLPVGETTDIVDGSTYDHNILMAQEYVHNSQRKEIEWKTGIPYCRIACDKNIAVRFHTLHMSCSGGLIEEYYNKAMRIS